MSTFVAMLIAQTLDPIRALVVLVLFGMTRGFFENRLVRVVAATAGIVLIAYWFTFWVFGHTGPFGDLSFFSGIAANAIILVVISGVVRLVSHRRQMRHEA